MRDTNCTASDDVAGCRSDARPKDYLQVFRLSEENGLQIVHHTSEQPQFEMTYIVEAEKPVTAKVYIIDDGEHCTMLLAEEY